MATVPKLSGAKESSAPIHLRASVTLRHVLVFPIADGFAVERPKLAVKYAPLMVVHGHRYPIRVQQQYRLAQLGLVVYGVDPKNVEICTCEACDFQPHECHVIHERQVACDELREPR